MSKPLNPGPPLLAGEEYCPCQPPTPGEYLRAAIVALVIVVVSAGGWFGFAVATDRLWGFLSVLIGAVTGWAIHSAAGRHRSVALGLMAAAATLLATLLGYGLLWSPLADPGVNRDLSFYHPIMMAMALFVAYRIAGPRPGIKPLAK